LRLNFLPCSDGRSDNKRKNPQEKNREYREIAPPTLSDEGLTALINQYKNPDRIQKAIQDMWQGITMQCFVFLNSI
jgi:hypothetical protein